MTSPFWLDTSRELTWLLNLLQSETQFLKIHHPPSLSFLVSSYDPIMEDFFTSSGSSDEKKTKFSANIYTNIIALDFKKSTNINKVKTIDITQHQQTSNTCSTNNGIWHSSSKNWKSVPFTNIQHNSPRFGVQFSKFWLLRATTSVRYVAGKSRWDSTSNCGNSHCQKKWNRQHWERKAVNHFEHVYVHEVMNKSTSGIPPNEPNCIDVYIVKHILNNTCIDPLSYIIYYRYIKHYRYMTFYYLL